ncbi:MAG TPA: outer membrane beta-barrel protein [Cytophagaceae bacterium]|jgi:hypothetical protein
MNKDQSDYEDSLRRKLQDFEMEPSARVWDGIDSNIGNTPNLVTFATRNFKFFAIGAIVAITLTVYLLFSKKTYQDASSSQSVYAHSSASDKDAKGYSAQGKTTFDSRKKASETTINTFQADKNRRSSYDTLDRTVSKKWDEVSRQDEIGNRHREVGQMKRIISINESSADELSSTDSFPKNAPKGVLNNGSIIGSGQHVAAITKSPLPAMKPELRHTKTGSSNETDKNKTVSKKEIVTNLSDRKISISTKENEERRNGNKGKTSNATLKDGLKVGIAAKKTTNPSHEGIVGPRSNPSYDKKTNTANAGVVIDNGDGSKPSNLAKDNRPGFVNIDPKVRIDTVEKDGLASTDDNRDKASGVDHYALDKDSGRKYHVNNDNTLANVNFSIGDTSKGYSQKLDSDPQITIGDTVSDNHPARVAGNVINKVDSLSPPTNSKKKGGNGDLNLGAKLEEVLQGQVSIDIFAAPEISYRSISMNAATPEAEGKLSSKNEHENPKLGMSVGSTVNLSLSDRLALKTGIIYSNFGENFNYNREVQTLVADSVLVTKYERRFIGNDTLGNPIYTRDSIMYRELQTKMSPSSKKYTYRTSYSFVSVPIGFAITFRAKKKMSYNVNGALNVSFFLGGKDVVKDDSLVYTVRTFKASETPYRSIALSLSINPTASYAINESVSITFGPVMRYFLTSIYRKEELLILRPYSLGLQAGVQFKF